MLLVVVSCFLVACGCSSLVAGSPALSSGRVSEVMPPDGHSFGAGNIFSQLSLFFLTTIHSLLFVAFWCFVRQVFFDLCLVMGESRACVAKLVLCLFLSRLFPEFPTVCCVHQGVEPLKKVPFGVRGKTFHQGSECLYESVLFPFLVTPLLVKVLLYPCLDL